MSRLAKKPIPIPENVQVSLAGRKLTVHGPLATVCRTIPPGIAVSVEGGAARVSAAQGGRAARMRLGTAVAHLNNLLKGAVSPFVKKLIVEGIGYKSEVKGQELVLSLGFSHPVRIPIPSHLRVLSEKNVITVSGSDIEAVGSFAASVRELKKPEPYKGKGIRYEDEIIRRKQGKKTV